MRAGGRRWRWRRSLEMEARKPSGAALRDAFVATKQNNLVANLHVLHK